MVAIHIPRPAEEWVPAHGAPETGGEVEPRVAPPRRVRPLPDRATRFRRRRLVALVAAVALVALLVVGVRALADLASEGGSAPTSVEPPSAAEGSGPVAGDQYVVQPGDTLWSIAATIAPDDDPRAVVDALRAANGGADLQVGQRLDLDLG